MAAVSFKGFGWLLCGVVIAPSCYLVSSRVAAERAQVEAVEASILAARQDIRELETEFNTRANMVQLERWNGDVLALAAPSPAQFLPNEQALASLGPIDPNAAPPAAFLVPHAGADPTTAPDLSTPPSVRTASASTVIQALPVERRTTNAVVAAASAIPVDRSVVAARSELKPMPKLSTRAVASAKDGEKVAMLDRKLLSDTTLGDLVKGARREALVR